MALTGMDLAAKYRDRYSTMKEALQILKDEGFASVADLVATLLPEIHPSMARVGDIAAVPTGSAFGHALGVVNGERIFVLMPDGVGTVDLLDASRAFKVG